MALEVGLVVLALLALIPAKVAQKKGGSAGAYFVFGFFLWPVALFFALIEKDRRRRCPHCAEPIQRAANVCPHCHRELQMAPAVTPAAER